MAAYYVQKDGGHFGPLSRDELQQYIVAGVLSVEDWAIEEGKDAWVPLGTYVQMPDGPTATVDSSITPDAPVEPGDDPNLQTAESSGRGMAVTGVVLLLMAGGAFGGWQIWGGKPTPPVNLQKEIIVSVISPEDLPQPPPPPKIEPLPTNNLPAAVAEELIFIWPAVTKRGGACDGIPPKPLNWPNVPPRQTNRARVCYWRFIA